MKNGMIKYFVGVSISGCLLSFTLQSAAQNLWSNCLDQKATRTNDMAVDTAGNSYITGNYYDSVNGNQKFFISKTGKNGEQGWIRYFPGSKADTAEVGTVITVDHSGNIIAAGYRYDNYVFSCSTYISHTAVFAVSYNAGGKLLWVNSTAYGNGDVKQEPLDIATDQNNSVFILYNKNDFSGGGENCGSVTAILDKITKTGKMGYSASLSPPNLQANALRIDNNNDLIVTGIMLSPPLLQQPEIHFNQVYTQKLNVENARRIWTTSFKNIGFSEAYAVSCDSRNNIYVYANVNDTASVLRYNTDGKLLGVQKATDNVKAITTRRGLSIDKNDNINIVAYKYVEDGCKWFIASAAPNGSWRWFAHFNQSGNYGLPVAIQADVKDNVYIGGSSKRENVYAFTTIKYNPYGTKLWKDFYNPASANAYANAMLLDISGDVYLSGNLNFSTACSVKIAGSFLNKTNEITVRKPVKKMVPTALPAVY